MSTKKVLKMLEKIADDKQKVHRTALAYCQDKCELVNSSFKLVFIKNGANKSFKDVEEFKPLLAKIEAIQSSDKIIDEMFEISDDVEKLRGYIKAGYLVPADKIIEGKESALTEAKVLCDNAKNYFLINGAEMDMLDKNFSVCRLRTFIEKSENGKELTQEDIKNVKSEVEKVRSFMEEGRAIGLFQIDRDIEGAKAIKELLEKFDPDFYEPSLMPKNQLDRVYEFFESKDDFEKRAITFYTFICDKVPKLLENIKQNCKEINLNYEYRLKEELEKLEENEKFEINAVERNYNNNKASVFDGLLKKNTNKMSKAERNIKINEVKTRYVELKADLEKKLREVIDIEKKKVSENLDTVYKVDRILKEKTVGYKFKVV